jgi:RNase P subunit RPR2
MSDTDLMITGYFEQRQCQGCGKFYREDSVEIIKRFKESVVVRVTCKECGKPLGTAIVGNVKRH